MEYDEYIRQKEAARKAKRNKWMANSIIGGFAITIANSVRKITYQLLGYWLPGLAMMIFFIA